MVLLIFVSDESAVQVTRPLTPTFALTNQLLQMQLLLQLLLPMQPIVLHCNPLLVCTGLVDVFIIIIVLIIKPSNHHQRAGSYSFDYGLFITERERFSQNDEDYLRVEVFA